MCFQCYYEEVKDLKMEFSFMFKDLVFALLLYSLSTVAVSADGWTLDNEWTDPFMGEKVPIAITTNEDGYSFGLFRSLDGRVRAIYSLPESTFDRVPTDGRVLMIRPGSNRSIEIEAEVVQRGVGEDAKSNGIVIRDLIWHGQDPSPATGTLRNLLDSDALFARFFTETGDTIDTSWNMAGSHPIIEQALGISAGISAEEQAWAALVTETLIGTMNRCNASGPNPECSNLLDACIDVLVVGKDKAKFDACLASKGFE